MKNKTPKTLKIIALAAACLAAWARTAAATTATLAPESRLELEGTSTLHPWEAKTSALQVALAFPNANGALAGAVETQSPATMTVAIPVKALKSEHSGLDKNMQKALKADQFPDITFALQSYQLKKDKDAAQTIVAAGELAIAGVKKPATLTATVTQKDGRLVLDGEQPVLMTDFGIKPPTMMMGSIKTGDRVVVKYHLELLSAATDSKSNGK